MNLYRFTKTYTDVYFFDVEAEDEHEAREKLCEMDKDTDDNGRRNIDVVTDLLDVQALEPEPDEAYACA